MRRTLFVAVLVVLWPVVARAQSCPSLPVLAPLNFEQITVSTTAIGFTASKITVTTPSQQAIAAVVTVESNPVRYRDDGTDPTSAVGQPVATGSQVLVCGRTAILQIKFIRSGGSDATLSVSYYRKQ